MIGDDFPYGVVEHLSPLRCNVEMHAEVVRDIPLGRLAKTDEIVGLAIFLASEASSYISGAIINIDGASLT